MWTWHQGLSEQLAFGPTRENDPGKYLEDCPRQKDNKCKDLKSSCQPEKASVVELIEVGLNTEAGDWWYKGESNCNVEHGVRSGSTSVWKGHMGTDYERTWILDLADYLELVGTREPLN